MLLLVFDEKHWVKPKILETPIHSQSADLLCSREFPQPLLHSHANASFTNSLLPITAPLRKISHAATKHLRNRKLGQNRFVFPAFHRLSFILGNPHFSMAHDLCILCLPLQRQPQQSAITPRSFLPFASIKSCICIGSNRPLNLPQSELPLTAQQYPSQMPPHKALKAALKTPHLQFPPKA